MVVYSCVMVSRSGSVVDVVVMICLNVAGSVVILVCCWLCVRVCLCCWIVWMRAACSGIW